MAKATKFYFNVDKLHLKLKFPDGLLDQIGGYKENEEAYFGDFWLHFLSVDSSKNGEIIQITANVIVLYPGENGNEKKELGKLTLKQTEKHKNEAYFEFSNEILYTSFSCEKHSNGIILLDSVLYTLGMEIVNIKELEIALDVNKNLYPKVLKMIRRKELYDLIYRDEPITKKGKTLPGMFHIAEVTREKDLPKSPVIKTAHKDLKIKFYNKSKEIAEESNKRYIEAYNDFGNDTIYRAEVTVKWERFLKWIRFSNSTDSPLKEEEKQYISPTEGMPNSAPSETDSEYLRRIVFDLLLSELYRGQLWHWCVSSFIRFYDKKELKKVDVIDLLGGYKVLKRTS